MLKPIYIVQGMVNGCWENIIAFDNREKALDHVNYLREQKEYIDDANGIQYDEEELTEELTNTGDIFINDDYWPEGVDIDTLDLIIDDTTKEGN